MSICPGCGEDFRCGVEEGKSRCWCFYLERADLTGDHAHGRCLCGECLLRSKKSSMEEFYRRVKKDR